MNDRDRTHIELFARNGVEYQAGYRIDRKAVYTAYVESCEHAGRYPISAKRFTPAFREYLAAAGIDYGEYRSQGGRYWEHIALTGALPPTGHTLNDRPAENPVHAFHAGLIDNLYTITAHLRAELLDLQAQVIELQEAEMGRVSTMKARAARLIVEAATQAGYTDE